MKYFLLSAVLVGTAINFPQTLGWISLVSLLPILIYIGNYQSGENKDTKNKRFIKEMFLYGFVFSLISTSYFLSTYPLSWLSITNPFVSIIVIGGVWLTFSASMAIPLMAWPFLLGKFKSSSKVKLALSAAAIWVILEYIRSWFITISLYGEGAVFGPHHTYYSLGYTLSHVPILSNLLAMGGLYLGSFFIVLTNFFFLNLFKTYKHRRIIDSELKILAILLVLIIVTSFFTIQIIRSADSATPQMSATLLNTNFPSGTIYTEDHKNFISNLAPTGVQEMEDLVISPEGFQLDQLFAGPSEGSQQTFIGTTAESNGKVMYFNDYGTKNKQYTSKVIQMPIGDYRLAWTDLILKLTQDEAWFTGYVKRFNNYQDTPYTLYKDHDSTMVIAGTICSDNISPYIFREETKQGATVLLNIASHAPFRDSKSLARQTIAVNTARAIENGRYFVVAANYDRSMIINDTGKLTYASNNNDIVSFDTVKFGLKTYLTPYVRFGDYILYFSYVLLLFFWLTRKK